MNIIAQSFNPWLSIWVKPRATVRWILSVDSNKHIIPLAILSGVIQAFDTASNRNLGDSMSFIELFLLCVIFGPFSGIIGLYLGGALLAWCGGKLGGHAQPQAVRTAIAWSSVPSIASGILLVPSLLLFREELFTTVTPRLADNPILASMAFTFIILEMILSFWSVVILLNALGEVHEFSTWKSLATLLFALGLLLLLAICAFALMRPFI